MSEVISFWFRLGVSGVDDGLAERQVLDPLRGPVGGHLADRHAPHLLGVGLEEGAVEAPAEAGDEPALVVGLVLRRADAGPHVGADAADGLDQAEVAEGVDGLERVVEVLAVVVDAALAGPHQEVLVGEDLVPEVLDRLHLGEEAVAADVEAPPVALDGAADAADHVVGLEDGGGDAELVELEGGGEAGGTGADDDDVARHVGDVTREGGVRVGHVGRSLALGFDRDSSSVARGRAARRMRRSRPEPGARPTRQARALWFWEAALSKVLEAPIHAASQK